MKHTTSLKLFLYSAASTLLLAVGFSNAAQKLDPVSLKSISISTMETGDVAGGPCVSCTNGGGGGEGEGDGKRVALYS